MAYGGEIFGTYVFPLLALVGGSLAVALPIRPRATAITLPPGVTYDATTSTWCTPTSWIDVISFFLGNYIAHAATVITYPGEPVSVVIFNMILAILLPSTGAARGVYAILRHAALYKDPVKQALRARALCMVVRSPDWKPTSGEQLHSLSFLSKELRDNDDDEYEAYKYISRNKEKAAKYLEELKAHRGPIELRVESPLWLEQGVDSYRIEIVGRDYQVFGAYELPDGYELAYVPPSAIIEQFSSLNNTAEHKPNQQLAFNLSSVYSFASALVSIVQILYALSGLYRSRSDQVTKYGYAAFSFTVLPYVIMSFVNLLGNLFTPRYSNLYLVRNEIMEEAMRRGGKFEGTVGVLESAPLDVDDTFVFSATLEEAEQELWKFKLGRKIYLPGDIEPLSEELNQQALATDEEMPENSSKAPEVTTVLTSATNDEVKTPEESIGDEKTIDEKKKKKEKKSKKDKKADNKPLLICPSCYNFNTIEQKHGNVMSISNTKQFYRVGKWLLQALRLCIVALPLAVIGGMSQFKAGSSTVAQRAWTMTWRAVGMGIPYQSMIANMVFGEAAKVLEGRRRLRRNRSDKRAKHAFHSHLGNLIGNVLLLALLATPAIGGFVVVSQMLRESASCSVI